MSKYLKKEKLLTILEREWLYRFYPFCIFFLFICESMKTFEPPAFKCSYRNDPMRPSSSFHIVGRWFGTNTILSRQERI